MLRKPQAILWKLSICLRKAGHQWTRPGASGPGRAHTAEPQREAGPSGPSRPGGWAKPRSPDNCPALPSLLCMFRSWCKVDIVPEEQVSSQSFPASLFNITGLGKAGHHPNLHLATGGVETHGCTRSLLELRRHVLAQRWARRAGPQRGTGLCLRARAGDRAISLGPAVLWHNSHQTGSSAWSWHAAGRATTANCLRLDQVAQWGPGHLFKTHQGP